jgi:regulator of replication initiation timing
MSTMNIEAEVRDMKQHIVEISKEIDKLLLERETVSMMKLAERSLSRFVESEPAIYRMEDLKVRYK